jgi:hypothetical protein
MQWRCALLLGLLVLAAGTPLRADPVAARTLLQQCAQRADSSQRGIEALRAACPGIDTALKDLGLDSVLPSNWKTRIRSGALDDLGALEARYAQPSSGAPLNPVALRAIAQRMSPPPTSISWWERFKSWLATWLESEHNRWPDWMRYLPNLGSGARYFVYGSAALLLIAVAWVIVVELRAAGLLGPMRRRARAARAPVPGPALLEESVSPTDLDAAPEHMRPVILLRLLVAALTRSHRIERDGILTCRELISAARFDTPAQREVFASVALSAERVLYGDPRGAPVRLQDDLLGGARGLYSQLVGNTVGQPAR